MPISERRVVPRWCLLGHRPRPHHTAVPAGAKVSGAPATTVLPVITIGALKAPVINAVPANVSSGAVALQASIGGAHSQSSVMLVIQ